jgi:hypothetical protein
MKWNFIAVLLLAFCWVSNVSAQSSNNGHFFVPTDIKWQRSPGAPRSERKRAASTVVLFLGSDGEFVRDECSLIRDGQTISISNGDPHNQYVGRTKPMADGVQIEYRLVRRTVERTGEVLPGPKISTTASTMAKPGLAMGGRFFRRVEFANGSEYLETYNTLARQYAEK